MREFKRIQAAYPERLKDMDFYMPEPPPPHRPTAFYVRLMELLPRLLAGEKPGVKAKPVWKKYRLICPRGYAYLPFTALFYQWIADNGFPLKPNLLPPIPAEDLKVLKKWRQSDSRRNWQIAVTLEMAAGGATVTEVARKIEAMRKTVGDWIAAYIKNGLKAFELARHKIAPEVARRMKERKEHIIKLLHEPPKSYGLNRTSWTITALSQQYGRVFEKTISWAQVKYCLKQLRYTFKKSRDVLTSQDLKFREKIKMIQQTLNKLKPGEKFFSIDEYGPVGIRIKGGRMLKAPGEPYDVPDKQKHKGIVICRAALELSTNQVSHFFSKRKNTFETIKLLEMLLEQYSDQKCIYLCWDAVSWHRSGILLDFIKEHNRAGAPEIKLAPLPARTQYLNVIESVFGGLARTVIHNSDYSSVDDCQQAITGYFKTRNQHFQENPIRAGKKIWGMEPVAAKFCETCNCRSRHAMRGVANYQFTWLR
ncbi:DDE superfamily endonuclease [Mucilaginibacter pineti]|uniref:DDE superfamily endonuclease n=1 Tax=Mucilaginibacter pineti TaxID=1391627 RepID=A0A1G6Z1F7_9SPHI|nr:IS630 family transposase [Mucilaginibacter pineti]SDD96371.1 DDE superfamily endonuclease [Mucilaginibacter pineti]